MEVIYVGIAAFLGAIIASLLGWADTSEPFIRRKFLTSAIRGLVGAIGIAVVFNYGGSAGPIMYLLAFLAGAGIDAGGNRVAGAVTAILGR